MNTSIALLKNKIAQLPETSNERSYYPPLCNFLESYGKEIFKLRELQAVAEESLSKDDKNIGFPDITVRNVPRLIGWIEVKVPSEDLRAEKFELQFSKYKDSLENIVFTNLREWELWQWIKEDGDNDAVPKMTASVSFDVTRVDGADSASFENFLAKFYEGRAYETRTPKQLALALARKTQLLSKQVEEALGHGGESDLVRLKDTFEKTLIQEITSHQFANMVAETLAYSLFLASLEHARRDNGADLTLTNAIDYLPTNVPVLADLYSLIRKIAITVPNISDAAQLLVDQLNAADIERIRNKLVEHKPGEDPVIQFYEPFLKEYDPKEREARGVYYTPKPVVDYIIKSVDSILRTKFGKQKGLADESVYLLDPATGTGTFLMSAIQQIYWDTKKENHAQGEALVKKVFDEIVLNHILKHFYGFELLIAPYAIAHLKLTLEVERLGFDFAKTKGDGDTDNDRFKIYLANTLDDPNKPPQKLFGFDSIPAESEKAQTVKRDMPILAIVGNPPYSNFGRMNRGEWILGLLKDYKQGLEEKKINLDDDFIKFIRFAQWKLERTGQGIFAMITSNTYVDGITHRQMRRSLMDTFDEIYIYNLHGNSRKGETAPDGSKDENVFNIQQGVSINIFVKLPKRQEGCVVKYCDLWGTRDHKFTTLAVTEGSQYKTDWQVISPKKPNWFFVQSNENDEYSSYEWSLDKVFALQSSGVKTERDNVTIHDDVDSLKKVIEIFQNTLDAEKIRDKLSLPKDSRDWSVEKARKDLLNHRGHNFFKKILYRPFDIKNTYYTGTSRGFIGTPGSKVGFQMAQKNIGLCLMRQYEYKCHYCYFFVTSLLTESRIFISNRGIANIAPLYLYKTPNQDNLLDKKDRQPNLSKEFTDAFSKRLGLKYIDDGRGNLEKSFGPEDIFYYAYAVFHSPTYRTRYAGQLKIDFPRLPITSDKALFKRLVGLGGELVNLHLLGENPFDSSKTLLDEPSKWNISIGGVAPASTEDWKVTDVRYDAKDGRVYVNAGQYFEGVEKEVWEFMVGGYQVCEKWLKDRKKAGRTLSTDDIKHYMKIVVSLRETIRLMQEIDKAIPSWPMK